MKNKLLMVTGIVLMSVITAAAQVVSNPPYTIEQSVIASGGGQNTSGGNFSLDGTIGQPVTETSRGSSYSLKSGFWSPASLAPTAAMVSVRGKVTTDDGRGIINVVILMTDFLGNVRTTRTTTFGYYQFSEVEVGATYVVTAQAKRFEFVQPTQIITVTEDTTNINFVAVNPGKLDKQ